MDPTAQKPASKMTDNRHVSVSSSERGGRGGQRPALTKRVSFIDIQEQETGEQNEDVTTDNKNGKQQTDDESGSGNT